MIGSFKKETPSLKRQVECSLISLHKYMEDVDIIGLIHEFLTRDWLVKDENGEVVSYGIQTIVEFFKKIKDQTGIDIEFEIKKFIRYLTINYVVDFQKNQNCLLQPLIIVCSNGDRVVDERFDAIFILEELYKYSKKY